MYLVVIAWLYVALMMVVAEATHPNGTLLGAIISFALYGLLPLALVVYLMGAPRRRKAVQARAAADLAAWRASQASALKPPDTGCHATGGAQPGAVTPVRKEP
ncbi:MAG: hypothetical protein RLZZ401_1220 [Pseudomonadota bacterium]|jgi:membrane protein implicated in regulation of membrane protease activity